MAPLPGRSGSTLIRGRMQSSFAPAVSPAAGNGSHTVAEWENTPAPAPPGQVADGNAGLQPDKWGRGGPPFKAETVLSPMQETWWRSGLQGTYYGRRLVDRHVYYRSGHATNVGPDQRTGGSRNPNQDGPPTPELATINVTVTPQQGSDNTANQDDLSRPYTWLGQQDGTIIRINGGTPNLWQPYASRGGYAAPLHGPAPTVYGGPSDGYVKGTVLKQGSPADVGAAGAYVDPGPPHGLHSGTEVNGRQWSRTWQTRYLAQGARIDRPDNSPQAGQSYSQLVQQQGGPPTVASAAVAAKLNSRTASRGWAGQ